MQNCAAFTLVGAVLFWEEFRAVSKGAVSARVKPWVRKGAVKLVGFGFTVAKHEFHGGFLRGNFTLE